MDITTLVIGIAAIAYSMFTIYARLNKPGLLGKLQHMQKAFGETTGTIIHVVAYTIAPLVFGGYAVLLAIQGHALF